MQRLLILLACLLSVACAPQQTRPSKLPDQPQDHLIDEQMIDLVAGRFSNHFRSIDGTATEHHFSVLAEAPDGGVILHQRHYRGSDREPSRAMAYSLASGVQQAYQGNDGVSVDSGFESAGELLKHFTPLDDCHMEWLSQDGQVLLQTPEDKPCSIGETENAVSISQQLRFDIDTLYLSQQFKMGDRSEQYEQEFRRVRHYRGWIGFRDRLSRHPGQWHRRESVELADNGERTEILLPTSGRRLEVELSRQRFPRTGMELLQIKVIEQGELIASAWASPESESVGLHLDWLQIGMSRQ